MPLRPTPAEAGRVYRKIAYGPLLDVFMLDMRSYRGPNGEGKEDELWAGRLFPRAAAVGLAQARTDGVTRDLEGDRGRHAARARGLSTTRRKSGASRPSRRAWTGRRAAASSRLPICSSFIKHAGVRNTVWLTADVHYTAAHYYDPNKAAFQDFEPFWEFVSGPIHAGSFGPNDLDNTFGPQLMYVKAPTKEQGQNLSPASGLQFFGHVAIDGATGVMTVTLKDIDDRALWSTNLEPK